MDSTLFAQSSSWIRVLETKLLNENELERMVLAKDARDAYKILNETDYSSHIGDIEKIESFQEVINSGLKDTKELISRITPENWVFNILWFRYDFHNLKVLLKAKYSGKDFDEIENFLLKFGAIPTEKLRRLIFGNEDVTLGLEPKYEEYIKESIALAKVDYEKDEDPQIIDIVLDKRLCKIMNDIALRSENGFLIKLTKKYIDLKNIELFIRLKIQKRGEDLLLKGFINRGYLEKYRFVDAFRKDVADFAESMKHTDYSDIIREAIKGYEDEKSFVKLDKLTYDHLTDYIQQAKRIAIGPEPVFAYFWAKKNNALVIRSIMVGKLNNIAPEDIRKIIRTLY
ncbi:V-type ATPase subunit [Patescibacteria group bacterium]|nr:V-type ATPase subunit [Patescibacteria group bacterium]